MKPTQKETCNENSTEPKHWIRNLVKTFFDQVCSDDDEVTEYLRKVDETNTTTLDTQFLYDHIYQELHDEIDWHGMMILTDVQYTIEEMAHNRFSEDQKAS